MKHFIYKTTHTNGKYYIGRHSTDNVDDGYIGSGRWPRSIKDKSSITREIIEYADSEESLILLEQQYLIEHYCKPNCMNMSNTSTGAPTGDANPMKRAEVVDKFKGDNHWSHKRPDEFHKVFSEIQNSLVDSGDHIFQTDNPNKDGRNAKAAIASGKHINLTNNPSIRRSKEGIHQWQNGNAPNAGGKLNKKLIEEGRHNFLGPKLNNKRIAEGTHNFLGGDSNQRRLAAGTHPSQMKKTCEHCGNTSSVSMYARWHGDKCKHKP
jgi:hypothetical protein